MRRSVGVVLVVVALVVAAGASGVIGAAAGVTASAKDGTTGSTTTLVKTYPAPTGPECVADAEGDLVITQDCVDPKINGAPYVDVDKQRTVKDPETGVKVSVRYVHGGFEGSPVKFAYYFPAADKYQGRFYQWTYPITIPDFPKNGAPPGVVAFGIRNGAAVVWSNNAGGVAASPTLGGYRANAAAAKFSKTISAQVYGSDAATRGYVFGGSGGAYQTLAAAENTDGVWAGSVPMVPGVPNAIPSFMSVQVLALRTLGSKMADVADAMDAGGSGDPYATLTPEEKAVLREATLMGHPLRGWWQWKTLRGGAFGLVAPAVTGVDASYSDDFFTQAGYEGLDPAVQAQRVQFDTTITRVKGDPPTAVTLAAAPTGSIPYVDLVVNPGTDQEQTIQLVTVKGKQVTLPADVDPKLTTGLTKGAKVQIDNSLYLALQYYQRHQVPTPDMYGWNQYRDAAGNPTEPQRAMLVGEVLSDVFGGKATGNFNGKMIMLSSVMDVQAYAWSADWYSKQAAIEKGAALSDDFRLWYMDNADHTPPVNAAGAAHIVSYSGEMEQALLDLDAWVTNGTPPPASSSYSVNADNQVELAATADARLGVQPVVSLGVTSGTTCDADATAVKASVAAGKPVTFNMKAVAPPGAGKIVKIEWDYDSTGKFPKSKALPGKSTSVAACTTYKYAKAGTHFAVVRVTLQRDGNGKAPFQRIQNLARVRVVVTK